MGLSRGFYSGFFRLFFLLIELYRKPINLANVSRLFHPLCLSVFLLIILPWFVLATHGGRSHNPLIFPANFDIYCIRWRC
jgi:hypothetical protein